MTHPTPDPVALYREERAKRPAFFGLAPDVLQELRALHGFDPVPVPPPRVVRAPQAPARVRCACGAPLTPGAVSKRCVPCRAERDRLHRNATARAAERKRAMVDRATRPPRACKGCRKMLSATAGATRIWCDTCAKRQRGQRSRVRRAAQRARGRCLYGGCTEAVVTGHSRCAVHLRAHREYMRASRQEGAAGVGLVPAGHAVAAGGGARCILHGMNAHATHRLHGRRMTAMPESSRGAR